MHLAALQLIKCVRVFSPLGKSIISFSEKGVTFLAEAEVQRVDRHFLPSALDGLIRKQYFLCPLDFIQALVLLPPRSDVFENLLTFVLVHLAPHRKESVRSEMPASYVLDDV